MKLKNFDITICGGGMVGMALANSLANNDFSVAIIGHDHKILNRNT